MSSLPSNITRECPLVLLTLQGKEAGAVRTELVLGVLLRERRHGLVAGAVHDLRQQPRGSP